MYLRAEWYWGHDFFSIESFLIAMASFGLVWVAQHYKMTHGDPNFFQQHKTMLIGTAAVLYLGIVIFNIYKTGFLIGLFGSFIQGSVYTFLALVWYKAVIFVLFLMPAGFAVCSGKGRGRTETEIVYRTRHH